MKNSIVDVFKSMIVDQKNDQNFKENYVKKIELKRERDGFKCKRCGLCCKSTEHVDICRKDIEKWRKNGRTDLYSDLMLIEWDNFGASSLFNNERTGRCPFLRKRRNKNEYYCKINDIKPLFCRQFPQDKEHANSWVKCPGFD